jgi:hypothetical protein
MKNFFVLTVAFMSIGLLSKAQCDGVTKWKCTKMKIIDGSGNVKNEKDENVTVIAGNKNINVTPEDAPDEMEGTVSEYTCNWTVPGKNGKTIIKSDLTDKQGKLRHATITIEAVDGKITITLEAEEEPTKILLEVASYEEVK